MPLASFNIGNVHREYSAGMAFRKQWTHLFSPAKQPPPHVAYHPAITFSSPFAMILSIGQVIVATIVRHGGNRTAPLGSQMFKVWRLCLQDSSQRVCEATVLPRVIVSARDKVPTGSCSYCGRDFQQWIQPNQEASIVANNYCIYHDCRILYPGISVLAVQVVEFTVLPLTRKTCPTSPSWLRRPRL
ncbi:hypothetical protein IQ06DRAFT_59742 [Phaeosphaeriaceae sp. SRC1lsM3a]|nr:hypothetical protein IQ06DRAFT_59742 [Stagonospora sp. SRC1lsM3a]